ncbi:MAG: chemotaxis protein [Pseudomonadota bacterium]
MALEDMPPTGRLDVKVMRLLTGVAEHGDRHLVELEQDLVQMDALLAEAINKLVASFMALNQAIERQQETLGGLTAGGALPPEAVAQLEAARGDITAYIGAAVTGLQFQDMTSQLVGRMTRHLEGLRAVFGALEVCPIETPGGENNGDAALAVLNDISDSVMARFAELDGVARSTVNQRHMDSGDIELF